MRVLKNQALCGIKKFSGNSNAVSGFLTLFYCAVFIRNSVRFCGIRTALSHPSEVLFIFFKGFSFSFFVIFLLSDGTVKLTFLVVFISCPLS